MPTRRSIVQAEVISSEPGGQVVYRLPRNKHWYVTDKSRNGDIETFGEKPRGLVMDKDHKMHGIRVFIPYHRGIATGKGRVNLYNKRYCARIEWHVFVFGKTAITARVLRIQKEYLCQRTKILR